MLSDIALFLIRTGSTLLGAAFLLRAWMQWVRLPVHHPLTHAVFQLTDWLVLRLRRVVPGVRGVDWSSLLGAWLTAWVSLMLTLVILGIDVLPSLVPSMLAALLIAAKWGIGMLMIATLLLAALSWLMPSGPAYDMLAVLTAPFLDPLRRALRRVLPRLGAVDMSPLALFLLCEIALIVIGRLGEMAFGFGASF